MKKGSFDIKTHDFEVEVVRKSQEDTDTGEFDNRSVCFPEVFRSLTKALGDETGFLFASDDRSIGVILEIIGPTNTNSLPTRRERCSFEGLPFIETNELALHSRIPYGTVRAKSCFMVGIGRFGKIPRPVVKEGWGSGQETVMEKRCMRCGEVGSGGRGDIVDMEKGYKEVNGEDVIIVSIGLRKGISGGSSSSRYMIACLNDFGNRRRANSGRSSMWSAGKGLRGRGRLRQLRRRRKMG